MINFNGLITTISEYSIQYEAGMLANYQFFDYLIEDHKLPTARSFYRLTESGNPLIFDGGKIMKELSGFATHHNLTYKEYCGRLMRSINKMIVEKYLSNVYEAIKSYNDHNNGKNVLKTLEKENWFQMLHLLRRNASHFDNLGKKLGFPQNFPKIVEWGGLQITEKQLGHTVTYTNAYAIKLIDYCIVYLKDHEDVLG